MRGFLYTDTLRRAVRGAGAPRWRRIKVFRFRTAFLMILFAAPAYAEGGFGGFHGGDIHGTGFHRGGFPLSTAAAVASAFSLAVTFAATIAAGVSAAGVTIMAMAGFTKT